MKKVLITMMLGLMLFVGGCVSNLGAFAITFAIEACVAHKASQDSSLQSSPDWQDCYSDNPTQ